MGGSLEDSVSCDVVTRSDGGGLRGWLGKGSGTLGRMVVDR